MSDSDLVYKIALSMLPGIGDINARKLVAYLGGVEAVFRESYRNLLKIPGIGTILASSITGNNSLDDARREVGFITKYSVGTSFYLDNDYPKRLKECPDSPVLFYYKGNVNTDNSKVISIVGTRNATRKGKDICDEIIASLGARYPDLVVISGLAYGVDISAHKSALKHNVSTIGVLAHGFKTIYPSVHTQVARDMLTNGGLITDFMSDEKPDRNNFLKRNRIIAGFSDATIVIESGVKGGAMVTADIAHSYNRDVFAIPGSPCDKQSAGCNMLIKSQKASLIETSSDIEYFLNWESTENETGIQGSLFTGLTPLEKDIMQAFEDRHEISVDELSFITGKAAYHLSSALLTLEFSGLLINLPGNFYRISHAKK